MKTVYYNGTVYTGALPLVQAFVEEDGRFVFAGTNEEARMAAGEQAEFIDLEGRFLCRKPSGHGGVPEGVCCIQNQKRWCMDYGPWLEPGLFYRCRPDA